MTEPDRASDTEPGLDTRQSASFWPRDIELFLPQSGWGWFGVGVGYCLLAGGFLQLVLKIVGKPTKGPEYDAFIDAHWWWLLSGPLVIVALLGLVGLSTRYLWVLWRARAALRRELEAQRQLRLTERVSALHRKVGLTRESLQAMAQETQDVAAELEQYLEERLSVLNELSAQVADKEQLSQLTPEQLAALDKTMLSHFRRQSQAGLRSQFLFLILAFMLGFVVNWLSEPALDLISRSLR